MIVAKAIYEVIAALVFLSGLFLLLMILAKERNFKRYYYFVFIPIIVAMFACWPIALIAGLFGVCLGVADTEERE